MERSFWRIGIAVASIYCGVANAEIWPADTWNDASPAEQQMVAASLQDAAQYALTGGGAGMVVRGGFRVYAWGDQELRFDLKSTTKSIGGTVLGLALTDNLLSLTDAGQQHLPGLGLPPAENSSTGWLDDIQVIHLATHTSGFAKTGGYGSLLFEPGTKWSYSDGGMNWLADLLTTVYREDLNTLLFRRVLTKVGITPADFVWRSHIYREDTLDGIKRREFGSGIKANADALARIGYLYLRDGNWAGEQIVSRGFVDDARTPHPPFTSLPVSNRPGDPDASRHYGMFWWTNADGTLPRVPTDAYWSWGLLDSVIIVIPSLDLVAVRAGPKSFGGVITDEYPYSRLAPFIGPIVQSVTGLAVPSLVGSTLSQSMDLITRAGLTLGPVTRASDPGTPQGVVLSQDPEEGGLVNGGTPVALTISAGSGPAFAVEPPTIDFGSQAIDTLSAIRTVRLTNTSASDLGPWSIGLTGVDASQYLQTHSCPASLASGEHCDIGVSFKPSSTGTKSASLAVGTESAGMQAITLSGTGVRAAYSISPTSIDFGKVKRNTSSAGVGVLVRNTGSVSMPVTSIKLGGNNPKQFSQTNNCGVEIAAAAACTVTVTFKPTSLGIKSARLAITPGGGASKKTVSLSGTGT